MGFTHSIDHFGDLPPSLAPFIECLSELRHGDLMTETLASLVQMTRTDSDRLDWKILRATLQDLVQAFQVFQPYRHTRKISIFGSSRLPANSPEYQLARKFAHFVVQQGFMVMTGAGGGIMEAGNRGAGAEQSFGLNIQLPFEQGANPYIDGDSKLAEFKYFFTRKLFFLLETDAIALFPGGFGTQDEAFECLTLCQTGKSPPIPLVLIDRPGGTYWKDWDAYIEKHLVGQQLINPEDRQLYSITDSLETAYEKIAQFYRVYHSSRYVGKYLILRLNAVLTDTQLAVLNEQFQHILVSGEIERCPVLSEESQAVPTCLPDHNFEGLPCLKLHFNQRDFGHLYALIGAMNQMDQARPGDYHPERR